MSKAFSKKLPTFALFLVILLSPLLGSADSVVPEEGAQKTQSMDMSEGTSENSHEHATAELTSSDKSSAHKHASCCEGDCMCEQCSCNPPVTPAESSEGLSRDTTAHLHSSTKRYLSLTLNRLTPPPII